MLDSQIRTKPSTGMFNPQGHALSSLELTPSSSLCLLLTSSSSTFPSWQNYVDYYKCINAKGEEFTPCKQFYRAYHSLCPNEWLAKWDEQRENSNFPHSLEP
ncbi:hypothetical protein CBS101457_004386 [Exobasidium rhododendri]|nr:hypothetical protein CBS101457_004386 [Exobasidium rhododendri]